MAAAAVFATVLLPAQTVDLPSSKQLMGEIPGHPQRTNSLPISMAVSPDGHYVVTLDAGYGTFESRYDQSFSVLDTATGTLADFPDARTGLHAHQTLYSGLAFSRDGGHIYASMASLTNAKGDGKDDVGSGIEVYSFAEGKIAPERTIHLPAAPLPPGRKTRLPDGVDNAESVPYPAAIAVIGESGHEKLLVAENLSDDVVLLDPATGAIERRFDLSESDAVPSTYPIALAVTSDSKRAYVALWNASEIVELDLTRGTGTGTGARKLTLLKPTSPIAAGTHPCAMTLSPDKRTLYVALANRDAVAAVNVGAGQFTLKGYFDTRLPGQSYFGAEPVALAVNADDSRLYVANMATDAIAVIDPRKLTPKAAQTGMVEPDGFIPTEWMPMSMAFARSPSGGKLYIATAKGKGTGPNNFPQRIVESQPNAHGGSSTYIGTLLYGSLAAIEESEIANHLADWTSTVLESNRMKAAREQLAFAGGVRGRIRHVIYIIKENRTYDQILGDLEQDGKPVGNGDASLAMYGQAVTPNEHKLALQFGVLDNFFDSGEVSGDGHVWSTAAIGTDYLEKTWEQDYRGSERTYDFEGIVAGGYPLLQKIPDVNEPSSGYLWGDLAAHGKSYYHFGEYISSTFCGQHQVADASLGEVLAGPECAHNAIAPGEPLRDVVGAGVASGGSVYGAGVPSTATSLGDGPATDAGAK